MLIPILLLAALVAFWQPEADPHAGQRLVKVNFIAANNKGAPITDLAVADLRLREDGHPRQIAFFRFAGGSHAAPTVVVLDRWNERFTTTATSWTEVRDGLKAVKPGDPVYLYFIGPKGDLVPIRPIPGPEDDPNPNAATAQRRMIDGLDRAMRDLQGLRDMDATDPFYRANLTFRDLGALRSQLAAIAGRKNLIWVTHGIPLNLADEAGDWVDFTPQMRNLAVAFNQSQIAIYPVDQSSQGAGADPVGQAHQGLELLASLTGGRWWSSDSSREAIPASVADGRSYYTVAYYSTVEEKDKKFHKIRLESDRKGIRFLARDGFEGAAPDPGPEASEEAAFRAALSSPLEAGEIAVTPGNITRDPQTNIVHVELRVNPADVLLDEHQRAHLSILKSGASEPMRVDVNVTPKGITITENVTAEKGATERYFVYDRSLRAIGSVTVKLP